MGLGMSYPTIDVLRSVDLWIKGCVKSCTFLLRRDTSSPPPLARLTDSFIQKYLHLSRYDTDPSCISLKPHLCVIIMIYGLPIKGERENNHNIPIDVANPKPIQEILHKISFKVGGRASSKKTHFRSRSTVDIA